MRSERDAQAPVRVASEHRGRLEICARSATRRRGISRGFRIRVEHFDGLARHRRDELSPAHGPSVRMFSHSRDDATTLIRQRKLGAGGERAENAGCAAHSNFISSMRPDPWRDAAAVERDALADQH